MRLVRPREDLVAVGPGAVRGRGVRPVLLREPCAQIQFDARHLAAGARQFRLGRRDAVPVAVPQRDGHADIRERFQADRRRTVIEQLAVVAGTGAHHEVGLRFLSRPHDRRGRPRHRRFRGLEFRTVAQQNGQRHPLVERPRQRGRIRGERRRTERWVADRHTQVAPGAPLVMAGRFHRHLRGMRVGFGFQEVRFIGDADIGELPRRRHHVGRVPRQLVANRHPLGGQHRFAVVQADHGQDALALRRLVGARLVRLAPPNRPVGAQAPADRKDLLHEDAVFAPADDRAAAHLVRRVPDGRIGPAASLPDERVGRGDVRRRLRQRGIPGERHLLERLERERLADGLGERRGWRRRSGEHRQDDDDGGDSAARHQATSPFRRAAMSAWIAS